LTSISRTSDSTCPRSTVESGFSDRWRNAFRRCLLYFADGSPCTPASRPISTCGSSSAAESEFANVARAHNKRMQRTRYG
jgi:hypothetical protein